MNVVLHSRSVGGSFLWRLDDSSWLSWLLNHLWLHLFASNTNGEGLEEFRAGHLVDQFSSSGA